jgi:hypothetical protein
MDNIFNSSKKKTSSSHKKSITRKKTSSSHKSSTPKSISIKVESKSPQTIEEFNLKFPEPLPDKINFDEKIAKKMTALIDKHEDIKPFIGDTLFKDIFYLYLFNKYKTNCLITQKYENSVPEMKIFIDKDEPNINNGPLKHLAKKIVKCILRNEPIIIIPLSLKITTMGKTSGHANLLIYRNNTRQLEHFEPHGADFQGGDEDMMLLVNETLDKDLNYLVENMNIKLNELSLLPVKLLKAHEVCPRLDGVQSLENMSRLPKLPIEPDGYCVAWSMFFAEMCLKNPEIPSVQIYKAILDERVKRGSDNNYFKKMIRGYTCFINNKMAKYFTEILGYEATSKKLHSYHNEDDMTNIKPPEMIIFLYKLNYLINEEANPDSPADIKKNKMLKDTLKKYTSFKKTVRKSTSSSDLSSKEKESRRYMKQLKQAHTNKFIEFIDRRTAKEKERKATEKIKKAEEKEKKAQMAIEERLRKAEEKERKATEQAEEKLRKAEEKEKKTQMAIEEKLRKAEEKERKATEQAEEKLRKAEEKKRKLEENLASKTAKSRPKTSKAKTVKNKSQSEPNDI